MRIAFLLGLCLMVGLIVHDGAAQILALLTHASWLLLWLVPLRALPITLDAIGWRALVTVPVRLYTLFRIACVREAINRLLPVANIGGEVVGIGLLARSVGTAEATASVVVEVLMTLVSQYLFVAIGVVCVLHLTGAVRLTADLMLLLAASLPVIVLLVLLMRYGSLFGWLRRIGARLLGSGVRAPGGGIDVDAAIRALCRRHGRLARSILWQLAGQLAGSAETWLALRWLGHPVGIVEAVAIESLTQAVRNFAFMVPAGIGVQEASLVGLAHVLGFGTDAALALSLAKRMREVLFGVPALLAWQWIEGRRGWRYARERLSR
ncbi:MAG: flippase-like domain-containing protein [Gammaproteobacteria bacterium]|nr:flippase-like domain-containing protein [Gammaproteobacteria bacterium]